MSGTYEHAEAEQALPVFTALWALAALFHEASYRLWAQHPLELLVNAAALFVLLRPTSLPRLTGLLAVQLVESWAKMPFHPNHWVFTTFVNLTILLALIRTFVLGAGRIDRARFFLDFAPAVRLELVMMYAWAAFHKLNRDYFDPTVSCAAMVQSAFAERYPILPSGWPPTVGIVGSVVVEAAIPIFLCVRRLRLAGIVLGALFHILLPLTSFPSPGVYNFSAMLFALYFLFAPTNLVALVRSWWRGSRLRTLFPLPPPARREAAAWAYALLLGLLVTSLIFQRQGTIWDALLERGPAPLWLGYATTTLTIFVLGLRQGEARHLGLRDLLGVRSALVTIGPVLVFLNGLCPYIGAKTETAFAMYSNLRTEGGDTNHFVWRRPLKLFDYQEDLVTILETNDERLNGYRRTGHVMTWFEFRRYLSRERGDPNLYLRFQRSGEPEQTIAPGLDLEPPAPWPLWLRKLLFFRPAKVDGPVTCEH